jgi:hypothetical protein
MFHVKRDTQRGALLYQLTGTLINAIAIIVGSVMGSYVVRRLPGSLQNTLIHGISLATLLIGAKMAWECPNIIVAILSLAVGGVAGEVLRLDARLNATAARLEKRFEGTGSGTFAKGFVTASLVFGVGAMAIMGALENGLTGKYDTLLAKSALDGITSIVFSSAFGIGVAFSALPIIALQGSISLLASYLQPLLSPVVVAAMSSTGGLLILGIALNLLGAATVKVANLLPAIVFAGLITALKAML